MGLLMWLTASGLAAVRRIKPEGRVKKLSERHHLLPPTLRKIVGPYLYRHCPMS